MIACKNLTLGYGGQVAVDHITFAVEAGDYLCILGENGSGKTTLVKALLGLLPPKSGELVFDGVTPREIGYLPQQSMAQRDFPASVWEVVLSGCLGSGSFSPFYTPEQKLRAERALAQMGMQTLKKRAFRTLSGGQRQRVLLARALCAANRLLLLDEPAASLDPAASAELYGVIERLNRDHGMTVIMVSHDLAAARRANTILQMASCCAFFGTADDYWHSAAARHLMGGHMDD